MVGELPRLDHPSEQNSSYSLEFWGTTLDCVTKDRVLERPVVASNTSNRQSATWAVSLVTEGLSSQIDEHFPIRNATITHRKHERGDTYHYYPCSVDPIGDSTIGNSSSPTLLSEIRVLVPITETTCHPKLVRYNVVISHGGGVQNITYSLKDGGSIPDYSSEFKDFHGTFEQFVQFSDAIILYRDFAYNLKKSKTYTQNETFASPKKDQTAQPRVLDNGTTVQACPLQISIMHMQPFPVDQFEIWPLSVFERRLPKDDPLSQASKFDPKMATELLINTTISALTLNDRFDIVNGTELRSFNIYRFEHKLTFFLPYGLALGIAIPIIALGLVALYVQNNGVSAMNGGFLQLLMTTTGRTQMEAVIVEGSRTFGGYENVSKELGEMKIRFGELIDDDEDECKELTAEVNLFEHGDSAQDLEESLQESDCMVNEENVQDLGEAQQISNGIVHGDGAYRVRRAGFGTAQDVRPLSGGVRMRRIKSAELEAQ
jgi:hypothetical protein